MVPLLLRMISKTGKFSYDQQHAFGIQKNYTWNKNIVPLLLSMTSKTEKASYDQQHAFSICINHETWEKPEETKEWCRTLRNRWPHWGWVNGHGDHEWARLSWRISGVRAGPLSRCTFLKPVIDHFVTSASAWCLQVP